MRTKFPARFQPYKLERIDLSHNMMPVLTEGVRLLSFSFYKTFVDVKNGDDGSDNVLILKKYGRLMAVARIWQE